MSESRTYKAKRNILFGFFNKIVLLLLPFAVRTVFLRILGSEYLGLGSLFSSILQVLSVAELGFSSCVVFSLYKPMAEKDTPTIRALLSFYRNAYRIIGLIILVAGLILTPFLPYLIKGDCPTDINIYVLYVMYLINTGISYFFFAYKSALIHADQRQDIDFKLSTVLTISRHVIQLAVLFLFKNYYIYLGIAVLFTFINNLLIQLITKRKYPDFFCEGKIDGERKKEISKQIKGVAIGKISQTTRNSFDSVIISVFCGLVDVAIYSNYYYIFNAVVGFLTVFITSISGGIGNSIATETLEKNYNDFKKINFYFIWISSWCAICLLCLYQPFMNIWVGAELTATNTVMILFCVYFYVIGIGKIRSVYSSSAGLWWEFRYLEIGEMLSNLALNFLLGYFFGMIGILIATIVTMFIFYFIGMTLVTFKCFFKRSANYYFLQNILYLLLCVGIAAITYVITDLILFDNRYVSFIIKTVICIVLPNIIYFCVYMANKTTREYIFKIKDLLFKNRKNAKKVAE